MSRVLSKLSILSFAQPHKAAKSRLYEGGNDYCAKHIVQTEAKSPKFRKNSNNSRRGFVMRLLRKPSIFSFILLSLSISFTTTAFADVPVVNGSDSDSGYAASNADQGNNTTEEISSDNNTANVPPPIKLTPTERLTKLEHQVNNLNQADFQNQIQTLRQQVDDLRGKLEEANHTIDQLKQQQLTGYQDLNNRISKLKTSDANSSSETKETDSSTTNTIASTNHKAKTKDDSTENEPSKNANEHHKEKTSTHDSNADTSTTADDNNTANDSDKPSAATDPTASVKETKAYQASYGAIRSGNYPKAISSLKEYLQNYPKGQYAARAHYWLGEIYYIQNETQNAIEQFKIIIQTFPHDKKVADAKLKIGFIYFDNSQMPQAKTYLQDVVKNYPGTSAARLASARLKQMKNL